LANGFPRAKTNQNSTIEMMNLQKPGPCKVKEEGSTEELLQRLKLYSERFPSFLTATGRQGD